MKLLMCGLTFLLSVVPTLSAAPQGCLPGTLASYIALGSGGCSIGTIVVANFAYTPGATGGAQLIPPDQIQVSPIFSIPATAMLTFSAKWQAGAAQTQQSLIKYTVTGTATNAGSLALQLGAFQSGAFMSNIAVNEHTNAGNLKVFANCGEVACQTKTTDMLQFSPASIGLQVSDRVKLSSALGTASLSSFTVKFDYCPACV